MSKGWRGLSCGMCTEGPEPGFRKSGGCNTFYEKDGADMYTIGQMAQMFGLPVSTLRYYDKGQISSNRRGCSLKCGGCRASASSVKRR